MDSCHRRGDRGGTAPDDSSQRVASVAPLAWGLLALAASVLLVSAFGRASVPRAVVSSPPAAVARADLDSGLPDDLFSTLGPGRAARISGLFEDFQRCCLPVGEQRYDNAERASLSRVAAILEISDLGRRLLREARYRNVLLCVDPATELHGYYRSQVRFIALNAGLSEPHRIVFLAHELGHVPQHPRYSNNRTFPPEDMIHMRRVREAAAEAVATRILWQLRRNGYARPWRQKLATRYGDIQRAFLTAWEQHPDSPDRELKATRAAFDQWFARAWRRDFYDRQTLRHLARISRDRMGLVPARRKLSEEFLAGIAWLGGENYLLSSDARPLLDPHYRGRISAQNRRRLVDILRRARWQPRPASYVGRKQPEPLRF